MQDRSIAISVAWADASNDRQIDPQETVTFTVYVSWAFFNQTENMILKVTDQGFEKILDAVQLTAGSGSVSVQYVTGFETPGMKTLVFRLEDSEGRLAAGKTVTVTVGGTGQPTVETSSWLENINVAVQKYAGIMLLLVVITLILVAWKLKR
ncbi:MAG: hypothetical protein RMK50_07300 [Nitrososphaerota archaeon]|nr:hypothetical protein [Candidatus Bathyarchaeota archaeon]MDW8194604.1 hypothetical protein [Nitrososphaerota archaeon]